MHAHAHTHTHTHTHVHTHMYTHTCTHTHAHTCTHAHTHIHTHTQTHTHSGHLLNRLYKIEIKDGNVLFNDALNTFYLRLYGIRYMVKYLSDSERGNPLPPHGLLFLISSNGSFICIIPQTG